MNKHEMEVFSFLSAPLAIPFTLDVTRELRYKLCTRTFLVSLGFSFLVNTGLVVLFSKNSDLIFGFHKKPNEKVVSLSLKLTHKTVEIITQNIDSPDNYYNQTDLLDSDSSSEEKKASLKPSKPFEAKVNYVNKENHESNETFLIFDPRIQEKLKNNHSILRNSKNKSVYLNNYSSIDGSNYTSFGDKCFNVRSLDNGMRNRKIWMVKCRGVKSASETIMDNVNQRVRERLKH